MRIFLVSVPNPVNNTPVLRALEYVVIILLWLFFMWVVRAVWVEVRPLQRRRAAATKNERAARRHREATTGQAPPPPCGASQGPRGRAYDLDDEVTVGRALLVAESRSTTTPLPRTSTPALFRHDGNLWVEDLGSTNGTWVNTVRIGERTQLDKGDLLQVGGTVFEVGSDMTVLRSGSATDTGLVRSVATRTSASRPVQSVRRGRRHGWPCGRRSGRQVAIDALQRAFGANPTGPGLAEAVVVGQHGGLGEHSLDKPTCGAWGPR